MLTNGKPPSILGVGLAFPMQLDAAGARPLVVREEDIIRASMSNILNTDITERPWLSKSGIPFGTRIRRSLFEDVNVATDIIRYETKRALDAWEPRIVVLSVDTSHDVGASRIICNVSFRYRATSRDDNFVTPYRLTRP